MRIEELKRLIEENLPHSLATVKSDDEIHFTAEVICPDFADKSRIQQQQMIYKILDTYIKSGEIHALSLKTRAV